MRRLYKRLIDKDNYKQGGRHKQTDKLKVRNRLEIEKQKKYTVKTSYMMSFKLDTALAFML